MNRWIRRTLIGVLGLAGLGAAGLALGNYLGDRKATRHIDVAVAAVPIPVDPDSLQRGHYLFATRGCAECHGSDGAGKTFIDGGGLYARAPDITRAPGGVVAAYRDVDWVRTIRHGVKPGGQPVFIMPSEDYNRLTDADLGALVAYVRTLAPAQGASAVFRVSPLVKTLYAAGAIRDAAEKIDHTLPVATAVAQDGTSRQGAYVANMCVGCHGPSLSGGRIPGGPPDWPAAANLTPGAGSAMARYAGEPQFRAMLRSGRRPDGTSVSAVMPFGSLRELDDQEVAALYLYLKELKAVAAGNR